MPLYVIDTSALLASLYDEPGKDRVDAVLLTESCLICSINLAELASKCADGGMSRGEIETVFQGFNAEVVALDRLLAFEAGLLRPLTRQAGLSLGDRACLAVAKSREAVALTGDRAWTRFGSLGIKVECFRPA